MGGTAYLAISSALIAVFAENLGHPVKLIGVQALVAAMILVLCRVEAGSVGGRVGTAKREEEHTGMSVLHLRKILALLAHWYPHLFFLFALRNSQNSCIW